VATTVRTQRQRVARLIFSGHHLQASVAEWLSTINYYHMSAVCRGVGSGGATECHVYIISPLLLALGTRVLLEVHSLVLCHAGSDGEVA